MSVDDPGTAAQPGTATAPPTPGRDWSGRLGRVRAAQLVSLVCFAGSASSVVGMPSGPVADLVYNLVFPMLPVVAAAVVFLTAAAAAPWQRMVWRSLAAAMACVLLSAVCAALSLGSGIFRDVSVADVFALSPYPLMYGALVGLARSRSSRVQPSMWLDGLVAGLGTAAVAVAVAVSPTVDWSGGWTLGRAVQACYPLADVTLLVLLIGTAAVLGLRLDRVLLLLGGGLMINLAFDVLAAVVDLGARDTRLGRVAVCGWILSVMVAAAAAARTVRHPTRPLKEGRAPTGRRVLVLPAIGTMSSVALLAAGWGTRFSMLAGILAIGCILVGLVRAALTFRDVQSLAEARTQAMTDELTGMPNRRALLEGGRRMLAHADDRHPVSLLVLDLDGFKDVNDGLGHHAGDALLRQVGPRMTEALASRGLVARLGGDEFAVLLPACSTATATDLAERICEALAEPFTIGEIRMHLSASIGVATATGLGAAAKGDGSAPDRLATLTDHPDPAAGTRPMIELLRRADIAMYAAKSTGGGVHAFVEEADAATGDRLRVMAELRTALEQDDQIVVHLQAQVDAATGRPCGAEALVRWQHPVRGLLSPQHLLPAATQAGLLLPLTAVVLERALQSAAGWWDRWQLPVSVNLAAPCLTDPDLADRVRSALERHGLPSGALTLEVVEDLIVGDPARGRAALAELGALGVRTSIDDYGTGYSSLVYLRDLPVDELKLDAEFTRGLLVDPRAVSVVSHTVLLAHELGMHVVAEGVEDIATQRLLTSLGCDRIQGYVIARPVPPADFIAWLEAHSPHPTWARGSDTPATVST